ncbi:MAG TPA: NADH-quinone oxidoreductase subunit C [Bacteroidales bacterium]|nr:NADH-quinone oxidoreductase subunit C [Bacteroidales bacterium]
MKQTEFITVKNNQVIDLKDIPEYDYSFFLELNTGFLKNNPSRHCVNYFGFAKGNDVKLICCMADDETHLIHVSSALVGHAAHLPSFTAQHANFEKFEREIHENFGIKFTDHPWEKPMRYAHNRSDLNQQFSNYPFYAVESEELHEVGVGPIHAGIIEPGHFRFICNGEQIMHLEIQLGYQHRGIEQLFLQKKKLLERTTLAESIAGDTVVGHTTAFVNLWESLCGFTPNEALLWSRTLALELERIAVHTGDLSALCADMAYQLGESVFGRLRTPIINFIQEWAGNRFAKGLIRSGKINYPFTAELSNRLQTVLNSFEPDFDEMAQQLFTLSSTLSRMEKTGILTYEQLLEIGTVGMAARMNALPRDIRSSHPFCLYESMNHEPIVKHHGDVYSRAQIRRLEIKQSIGYLRELLLKVPVFEKPIDANFVPKPNAFVLSLVEGWRGEICHCALTDAKGNLKVYKIKDPSHHNWMALAQAVRNNDISDFPICNKSFNLSYSGHDL